MEREVHILRMRETAALVIPRIRDLYNEAAGTDSNLARAFNLFVSRRTNEGQPLLRPYLVRLGYEVSGGSDWREALPVCVASEVFNISTYQANVAFDGKLTVKTQEDRAEQFACSMISMERTRFLIRSVKAEDGIRGRILDDLERTNREIYHGQLIDLRELSIREINPLSDFSKLYVTYEDRCRRLGGELTRWCFVAGGLMAGANQRHLESLSRLGLLMGTAGQMLNDIGDFVPASPPSRQHAFGLRYQVPYSDVRNGKATYPLLYALEAKDAEVYRMASSFLGGEEPSYATLVGLTMRLQGIGAFNAARKKIVSCMRQAAEELQAFPPSPCRSYVKLALSTLSNNKYFSALRSGLLS